MELSIVIPCKDDPRVVKCVDSIDVPGEILIIFNGSSNKFVNWVKLELNNKRIRYQSLEKANLALALEVGVQNAKHDMVLLMDSDCTFEKGALQQFLNAAEMGNATREVYKGIIIFKTKKGILSSVIAKSRQHHTGETLCAYKPPLAFSKKIAPLIGGYFFDRRLIWREDSDLDHRIRQANIDIVLVPDGKIYHEAVSFKTDLRSTFRYGIGAAIAKTLNIRLTDVPHSVFTTLRSQGFLPAIYMLFRNRIYDLGYIYMHSRIILRFYDPYSS